MAKTKSMWVCPQCDQRITLLVKPSTAPVCHNHPRAYMMKEVDDI